jgi:aspartate ammonia-lyase
LLRHAKQIHAAWQEILELGIGGTAAGTGTNAHEDYARMMVEELSIFTGLTFRETANRMESMQSQAPVVRVSGASRDFALDMIRIANDLRLLSSGPTTGFSEIVLPPVQPGSSIMPGKVNPVVAECMNMICFQVLGNDTAIAFAAQAGQLELNVMMPLMAYSIIQSIRILTNGCRMLREKCVEGIIANADRCLSYAERTMGLATALSPHLGYQQAAEVAKESLATGRSIKEIVLEKRLLPPEKLSRILDTHVMTEPGIPGGHLSTEQGEAKPEVDQDQSRD